MSGFDLAPAMLPGPAHQAGPRLVHAVVPTLACCLAFLLVVAAYLPAQAQNQIQFAPNPPAQKRLQNQGANSTVMFREDRAVNRAIDKAREAMEAGSFDEAVHILGDVLQIGEDFFYRRDGAANLVSVKAEVRRLLGSLPADGRQQLEMRYGAEARRRLQRALETGDRSLLADVSSRFFHTAAGYEATWLLALHHRDRGEPLAAALALRQLNDAPADVTPKFQPALSLQAAACWLQAGMDELAAQELAALKAQYPDSQIQFGDRRIAIAPAGQNPLDWLAGLVNRGEVAEQTHGQWLVHRGTPHRNQALPINSPVVATAWRAPAYDNFVDIGGELGEPYTERGVRAAIYDVEQLAAGYGEALLPSAHPLVVGETIIFRTATQLVAVDAANGKRLWTAAVDQQLQERLYSDVEAADEVRRGRGAQLPGRQPIAQGLGRTDPAAVQLASALLTRVVSDATYGTLSSDGQQVFAVEESGLAQMHPQYRHMRGTRRARAAYNTLRGYDVATGKLKWELGGEPGDLKLELAGHWFLGPPLPLGGLLYAMVEHDDEIRLVCLDAYAPVGQRVQWSQSLCVLEQDAVGSQARRSAGVSPSFADGVLVCPTASGAVVAVDLTSRSLLWAYQFPPDPSPQVRNCWLIPTTGAYYSTPGWIDASVTIHRGCVLLTPPGSSRLHGLRLLDGSPLWEPVDRGDAVYVAGCYDDQIVLVGSSTVQAVHLETARVSWRTQFPGERLAAGRGFLAGDCYQVPLTDGGLAQVRLNDGEIAVRPLGGSADEDRHAGNLIAVGDRVYCQHLYGCDSYLMVSNESLKRRLETNQGDAEAWLIQGDMQLQKGQLEQATASLRRAITLGSEKARPLLAECLLRQLRADFSRFGSLREELEGLIGQGPQAVRYWQMVAQGHTAQGKRVDAVRAYLRLAAVVVPGDGGELTSHIKDSEPALSVRQDRLVAARLHQLWIEATDDERKAIDAIIQTQLEQTVAAAPQRPPTDDITTGTNPSSLQQAIDYFGWHPASLPLKWQRVEQLQSQGASPRVEIESALREILASAQRDDQARALAALAQLFADAQRWDAAAWYAGQLKEQFAVVALPDGQTASEVAEKVLKDAGVQPAGAAPWPGGQVHVRTAPAKIAAAGTRAMIADAPPLPQFGDALIEIDNSQHLVASNLNGELWRVPFRHPVTGHPIAISSHGHRIGAHGRLLVFSTGCYLLGIDTAGSQQQAPGQIRWVQPLIDQYITGTAGPMFALPHWETTAWGTRRVTLRSAHSDPLGSLQPVVGRQVTFVRGRQLVSLDVLTGLPLWVREGVPEASEVFGDDECIYLVPPDRNVAQVYRTADGAALPTKRVPPWSHVMRAIGSKLLAWSSDGKQVTVRLFDVATQQDLWTRTFDNSAKAAFADNGRLGVLQGDGKFQLIEVDSGKALIDAKVDPIDPLGAIFVLRHQNRYMLAATQSPNADAKHHKGWVVRPLQRPGPTQTPAINGAMHGFDEQGRLAWSQPTRNLSLPLNQPSASPVISLMCHWYSATGQNMVRSGACLVLVDVRSGRVIHNELLQGIPQVYEQHVDREKNAIEFRSNIHTVRMQWTAEAWPDDAKLLPIEPNFPAAPQAAPGNAPRPLPANR